MTIFHLYSTELPLLHQVILHYINYSWPAYTKDKNFPFLNSLMIFRVINLNSMEIVKNELLSDTVILSLSITSKSTWCLMSVNKIFRSVIMTHKVNITHTVKTYLFTHCLFILTAYIWDYYAETSQMLNWDLWPISWILTFAWRNPPLHLNVCVKSPPPLKKLHTENIFCIQ